MRNTLRGGDPFRRAKTRVHFRTLWLTALGLWALVALWPGIVYPQKAVKDVHGQDKGSVPKEAAQEHHKDARTDVKCAVVEWNITSPKPTMRLVCPPEEVFAPLRVYFDLSWAKREDVPTYYLSISAPPKTQTKMHWNSSEVHVWLKVYNESRGEAEEKWVSFSEVVGFWLINGT